MTSCSQGLYDSTDPKRSSAQLREIMKLYRQGHSLPDLANVIDASFEASDKAINACNDSK